MYIVLGIVLFVLLWFSFGILAAGYTFAYFQRKYQDKRKRDFFLDKKLVTTDLLMGPVSLLSFLSVRRYGYGWLNPWGKKAKKEAGLI